MTDERMKQLMWQVGMPNSLSLYGALQQAENEGFQAGAACRDAEVAELKTVPMKYRRMAFNAQLQAEVAELAKERDQFRAELVKALAACKVKDEALRELDQLIPVGATIAALAIQPDDAALKAWLGEPVSYLYKHYSAFGDDVFWSHRPNHQGVAALETKALYSPKELK